MREFKYQAELEDFTLNVPEDRMEIFEKELQRLSNLSVKLGFGEIKRSKINESEEEIEFTVSSRTSGEARSFKRKVKFHQFKITGVRPRVVGYKFVFKLTKSETDGAPMINISDIDIPDRFLQSGPFKCDLCQTTRSRKSILGFISESGDIVTIGGECASQFSAQNLKYMSEMAALIQTYTEESDSSSLKDQEWINKELISLYDVLAVAGSIISREGYRKSSEDGSTKSKVLSILNGEHELMRGISLHEKIAHFLDLPDKTDFIKSLKQSQSFEHNFITLSKSGVASEGDVGILCYLAFLIISKEENNETAAATVSEKIGEIGEKREFCGKVLSSSWRASSFAYNQQVCYVLIKTDDGHLIELNSTSFSPSLGESVHFVAKIKGHRRNRDNVWVTTVNYPKSLESNYIKNFIDYADAFLKRGISSQYEFVNNETGEPLTLGSDNPPQGHYRLISEPMMRLYLLEREMSGAAFELSCLTLLFSREDLRELESQGSLQKEVQISCHRTSKKEDCQISLRLENDLIFGEFKSLEKD